MKIGIIGSGNIGTAIVSGLAKGSFVQKEELYISDLSETRLKQLEETFAGIHTTTSNREVAKQTEIIILAVKPWLVESVLNEIKEVLNIDNQILISVAAGISLHQLQSFLEKPNAEKALFRMIPNTAISVQQGVCIISHNSTHQQNTKKVETLFKEFGSVFSVPETQLNAFMSLSSCGIAYAFRYIRAAIEGAVEMGIPSETAQKVVVQTLVGATELLKTNKSHPEVEIDKVTTPGGITIKGLNEMEANGFTNAVVKGLKASLIK